MKPLNLSRFNANNNYALIYVNDSTYDFVTEQNVRYRIGFLDDESLQSCETYQFYISKLTPLHSIQDDKIKTTIIAAIEDFFEENKSVLLYMCDTADGRQELRSKLFYRWFSTAEQKSKYLCKGTRIVVEDTNFYAAIILRRDNPRLHDVEEEFDTTVRILSDK